MLLTELNVNPEATGATLPSLNDYVAEAALRGALGVTNANQLLAASDSARLSKDTYALLEDIAEDGGSSHPQIFDYEAPLLRSVGSFDYGDRYMYNVAAQQDAWEAEHVEGIEYDAARPVEHGRVIFRAGHKLQEVSVKWPALVPFALHEDLTEIGASNDFVRHIKDAGRVFFELSYYDQDADDMRFASSIGFALESYGIKATP